MALFREVLLFTTSAIFCSLFFWCFLFYFYFFYFFWVGGGRRGWETCLSGAGGYWRLTDRAVEAGNQIPMTFIYGESDWMDPKTGVRVCKAIRDSRSPFSQTDLQVSRPSTPLCVCFFKTILSSSLRGLCVCVHTRAHARASMCGWARTRTCGRPCVDGRGEGGR